MLDLGDREAVRAQLVAELHKLALRGGKDHWFKDAELKPLKLPFLEALASEIYPGIDLKSSIDIEEHFEALLRHAIAGLPREPPKNAKRSWRWAAETLFCFAEIKLVDESSLRYYDKLVNSIKEIGEFPMRLDRMTNYVRTQLADNLIRRLRVVRDLRNADVLAIPPDYVSRPAKEKELTDALIAGQSLILVHGDAGTGKSTLAREIARRYTASDGTLVYIYCRDEHVLLSDLHQALRTLGEDDEHLLTDVVSLVRQLRRTISKPHAHQFIVLLDDVAAPLIAEQLFTEGHHQRILVPTIVTGQEQFYSSEQAEGIQISNMTLEEAVAMVRQRMPDITAEEADELATELGGRPLAISHGIALLKLMKPRPSVSALCAMIRRDVIALLDTVPTDVKLTAIYRRLLYLLASDESAEPVYDIMAMLTLLGNHAPVELLYSMFDARAVHHDETQQAIGRHVVDSALDRLKRLNLLTAGNELTTPFIFMHQLTHRIITGLLPSAGRMYLSALAWALKQHLAEIEWYPEMPLLRLPALVHMIYPFWQHIESLDTRKAKKLFKTGEPEAWAKAFAATLRYLRQVGHDYAKVLSIALILAKTHQQLRSTSEFQELYASFLASGLVGDKFLDFDQTFGFIYEDSQAPYLFDTFFGEDDFSAELISRNWAGGNYGATKLPFLDAVPAADTSLQVRKQLCLAGHAAEAGRFSQAEAILESVRKETAQLYEDETWELQAATVRRGLRVCIKTNHLTRLQIWLDRADGVIAHYDNRKLSLDRTVKPRLEQAVAAARWHRTLQHALATNEPVYPGLAWMQLRVLSRFTDIYEFLSQPYLLKLLAGDRLPVAAFQSSSLFAETLANYHDPHHRCFEGGQVQPSCLRNLTGLIQYRLLHLPTHDEDVATAGPEVRRNLQALAVRLLFFVGLDVEGGHQAKNYFPPRPYHRASVLLTALAILMLTEAPARQIDHVRSVAGAVLAEIQRLDRLELTERIGRAELPASWLLAG